MFMLMVSNRMIECSVSCSCSWSVIDDQCSVSCSCSWSVIDDRGIVKIYGINCYTSLPICHTLGFIPISYAFPWDSTGSNTKSCSSSTAPNISLNSFSRLFSHSVLLSLSSSGAASYPSPALTQISQRFPSPFSQVLRSIGSAVLFYAVFSPLAWLSFSCRCWLDWSLRFPSPLAQYPHSHFYRSFLPPRTARRLAQFFY